MFFFSPAYKYYYYSFFVLKEATDMRAKEVEEENSLEKVKTKKALPGTCLFWSDTTGAGNP